MAASNTHECFSEFIGQKVIGVLFDALPPSRADIARGTHSLVFEDGRALTISATGTYWINSEREVQIAINRRLHELDKGTAEIKQVLELAGVLS